MTLLRRQLTDAIEQAKAAADAHNAAGHGFAGSQYEGKAIGLELALALLDGATHPTGLLPKAKAASRQRSAK
jgi:hypothetical protein